MSNIFLEKCGNSPIFGKVAVKMVTFCIFGVVLVRIHFLIFSKIFDPGKFAEFQEKFKKMLKGPVKF